MCKKITTLSLLFLSIFCLFGCLKKKKVETPVIQETVKPTNTGETKNNLGLIQNKINKLEDFEYIAINFMYNNQKLQRIFKKGDSIYTKVPNIKYNYYTDVEDEKDNIYYIYNNTENEWLQDILPEDVEDPIYMETEINETEEVIIEESETNTKYIIENSDEDFIKNAKKVRIINILDEIENIESNQ